MKAKLITAFYTVGLLHHLYTAYYSRSADFSKSTRQEVLDVQLFSNRFLTSWNMALQTIYFMVALTFEILLLNKNKTTTDVIERVGKIRGFMFTTFILPSTVVVSLFFWFFYHIDREFLIPAGVEEIIPEWVNHSLHTNIIFLPIFEIALKIKYMYIPSFWTSAVAFTLYSHFYHGIYYLTYFETGKWMYPLYNHLSWFQRIFLTEFMFATGFVVLVIGHFMQRMESDKCDITKANFKTRALNVAKKLL